MVHIQY